MGAAHGIKGNFVRPEDRALADELRAGLRSFGAHHPLPGIATENACDSFIEQLIESIRRIRYTEVIRGRNSKGDLAADPTNIAFDPLKAAVIHKRQGNLDEAFWLIFLSVHFGKHKTDGWLLTRSVYGGLGAANPWTWQAVTADPKGFRKWYVASERALKGADGIKRRFGNHRKYESLSSASPAGTLTVIESYVQWIAPPRSHSVLISTAQNECSGDSRQTFGLLYKSMGKTVQRFGRTARFDYLSMLGKLGVAAIEPDSAYLVGATGPLTGAKLLFTGRKNSNVGARDLDRLLIKLDSELEFGCGFGLQVLEDAICNWQKSPNAFRSFRG